MAPFLDQLIPLAEEQGGRLLEVSLETSLLAATLAWDHRDPFDRIIAATAITRGLQLISTDSAFAASAVMQKWPGLVWSRSVAPGAVPLS